MQLFGALAVTGAMLALPLAANATTYISKLEYKDGAAGTFDYGTVKLEELAGGNDVKVTVNLDIANALIVDTGGHSAFAFNLLDTPDSTIDPALTSPFSYNPVRLSISNCTGGNPQGYHDASFGCFTNTIASSTTGGNGTPPPLVFTVHNDSGITFAGIPTLAHPINTDPITGAVTSFGEGNRFRSNALGWWFALDIYDPDIADANKRTFLVGAKDASIQGGVPEPASWALMLVGFGGMGALLRRSRRIARTAVA